MKRLLLVGLLAIGLVAAFGPPASADVALSHHDLSAWSGGAIDTCRPCHGFKQTTFDTDLGRIGTLCYLRCHSGDTGTFVAGMPLSTQLPEIGEWTTGGTALTIKTKGTVNVADVKKKYTKTGGSHGLIWGAIPGPDTPPSSGWRYTANLTMECTTCHDVHTNTNFPFLVKPLEGAALNDGFCQSCHTGRNVDLTAVAKTGNHPYNVPFTADYVGYNGAVGGTPVAGRLARRIALKETASGNDYIFRNVLPATLRAGGSTPAADHYNPGGKLSNGLTTGGRIGCYSCHAVHSPATVGANAYGVGQLLVAPYYANDNATVSAMCVGCHGGAATDGRNPGGTAYYHPVNGEVAGLTPYPLPADNIAAFNGVGLTGWTIWVNLGNTDVGRDADNTTAVGIVCTSCHAASKASQDGVHNLASGKLLLSPTKPNCNGCHNSGSGSAANVTQRGPGSTHHPMGGLNYSTSHAMRATVQWNADNAATLTDGLGCSDCHSMDYLTAHNWN